MAVVVADHSTDVFLIVANCTGGRERFGRQRSLPALDKFPWVTDFDTCLGIELLLQDIVEGHADAVDEYFVRPGDEFRAAL